MTHGSLFSGGGGFDLAAKLMGWRNLFHCEIDPFCNRLLDHYFPEAKSFKDIRHFDATPFKGRIDIITGGFPCQPFSLAGKRKGTKDSRYLWPDMLRVIREIEPTWVVGENVYGILNWNQGLVFEQVHTELEAEGYEVQAFILPAAGVNAPHRRNRVWFVGHKKGAYPKQTNAADANGNGQKRSNRQDEKQPGKGRKHAQCDAPTVGRNDPYRHGAGLEGSKKAGDVEKGWQKEFQQYARLCTGGYWKRWPTESPLCGGDDGLPRELDGITFSQWRAESIKLYGNAVVPQMVYQVFKAIEMTEQHKEIYL